MWLLDANLDIRIRQILTEVGIESRAAENHGWKHLSNGNLVFHAATNGDACLLTRDQLFAQSASPPLKQYPGFAIVVVRLRQQKWPAYGDSFREAWHLRPIIPIPGQPLVWPV